jgi:hypothetical protein
MEYNRLPKLINKYPQTGNYITTGVGKSSLFGLYSDVNKIDFKLELLDNVTIVPDTKIRTVIAIFEDRNDETPQYYTSEFYHRDLSAATVDANPYFINTSFKPSNIVNVYLKEIVNSLDSYRAAELKRGIAFARNNFILFSDAGISNITPQSNTNTNTNTNTNVNTAVDVNINNELNSINDSISKLENQLLNVPNKIVRTGFFGTKAIMEYDGNEYISKIPFNRKKQEDDIHNQLSEKLLNFKNRKKEIESQKINSEVGAPVTTIVSKELKKENIKIDKATFLEKLKETGATPTNPKDIIEINGVFVDCLLLVKYIDWVMNEPALDEIENNGVIPSINLLDKYEQPKVVVVDKLDSNNNTTDPITKEVKKIPITNEGTGNFFEYQIVRLSIPASPADSTMTFKTSTGEIVTIAIADYGYVGTYCIEENSFNGNDTLYQKTQLAPCNVSAKVNDNGGFGGGIRGGGGGNNYGGGSYDYYDNQNRNIQYIDRQRDFQNLE